MHLLIVQFVIGIDKPHFRYKNFNRCINFNLIFFYYSFDFYKCLIWRESIDLWLNSIKSHWLFRWNCCFMQINEIIFSLCLTFGAKSKDNNSKVTIYFVYIFWFYAICYLSLNWLGIRDWNQYDIGGYIKMHKCLIDGYWWMVMATTTFSGSLNATGCFESLLA